MTMTTTETPESPAAVPVEWEGMTLLMYPLTAEQFAVTAQLTRAEMRINRLPEDQRGAALVRMTAQMGDLLESLLHDPDDWDLIQARMISRGPDHIPMDRLSSLLSEAVRAAGTASAPARKPKKARRVT